MRGRKLRALGTSGALTIALMLSANASVLAVSATVDAFSLEVENGSAFAFVISELALLFGFLAVGYLSVRSDPRLTVGFRPAGEAGRRARTVALVIAVVGIGTATAAVNPFGIVTRGLYGRSVANDALIALVLGVLFLFVSPPIEEFVFRGVIQQRLAMVFSSSASIAITSSLFLFVHFVGRGGGPLVLVSGALLFSLSVLYGALYERTDSLFLPTLSHAIYNGLIHVGFLFRV